MLVQFLKKLKTMNRYIILDEFGFIRFATNELPEEGVLFTEIDYVDFGVFLKYKFDFQNNIWIEGVSQEEIEEYQVKRYEDLDREYTQKISDLISTHVQKFITRQIPIPQEILEEQQRLIDEFHELTNKELKK